MLRERRITARAWLAALAIAAWAHPVRAQSYYARWAVLESDGVPVATLARAPIDVLSSASGAPEVRYADRAITLRARVALDAPYTEILVAVGRRARLDSGTAWAAWLAPDHWMPMRRSAGTRPEIALPEELPFSTASIAERAPRARRAPDRDPPEPPSRGWLELRETDADDIVVLRAEPSDDTTRWEVPLHARLLRRSTVRGWIAYDVWLEGVVVRGYTPRELPARPLDAIGPVGVLEAITAPWCHGVSTLDARVVPAGTELFVPGSTTTSFGRTRRALVARRIDEHVVELRETGDRHWVVRAGLAIPTSELEPAIAQWAPDAETCQRPPPWPE